MLWNLDGSVHLASLRLTRESGYGLKKWVHIGPPAHESLTLTQDVDSICIATKEVDSVWIGDIYEDHQ